MPSTSKLFKLLLAGVVASVLAACGNNTTSTPETSSKAATLAPTTLAVDAYRPPASSTAAESPMKSRDLNTAPVATNIALGAPQASQNAELKANNSSNLNRNAAIDGGKPLQIGFGRVVAQTATSASTNQVLKWQATPFGGQVAAINFSSTGAKGMRIGLLVTKLPASATLRFYAKGDTKAFEIIGADVNAILARNLAAGDKTDEARTYVGPMTAGADSTIEIELPLGVASDSVDVAIPSVSHMAMSANQAATAAQALYTYTGIGDDNPTTGLSCQVDVKCRPSLPAASDAVALIGYKKSGLDYICSGTLLNDNIPSTKPYFLTANHCLSTQTSASTVFTWWQYKSSSCNAIGGSFQTASTNGSTLLYSAYGTDSTLLLLGGTPPAGSLFAGWDTNVAPTTGTAIHSIHHPTGDAQRYSAGTVTSYYTRNSTNANYFFGSNLTNGTILGVTLTTGLTEPGSSGSGLFKGAETNPQVIGQLFGGPSPTCGATPENVYGRFDVAYNAGMSDWLSPGVKSVTQLYNAANGVHYYAWGVTDPATFKAANAAYTDQGITFYVNSAQTAGLLPVYRFYNTSSGTYFYTISEKERAAVATNTTRMRYDGIVWYASTTAVAGTTALYRAFNTATGSQFFTTNSTTRSNFITANPQFKADGVAFYVPI